MSQMRVLVVIDSFSFGGAENLLAVLAGAAEGAGIEFQAASLAPSSQGRIMFQPVLERAKLAISFLDVARLADPTAVFRIARAIRASRCDIVHAHLGYSAILVPVAARLVGVPCVSTLHHVPEDLPWREAVKEWLMVKISGRLGTLVFVSEASRDEFARRYGERPGSWVVIHNGVDLETFEPTDAIFPEDLGIPPGTPVVTIVAALREPKGHAVALHAWRDVVARVPQAQLLIVGDGVERARLEDLASRLGLDGSVVFAGVRHDVPRLMQASTLIALPSFTEALPTALIEAAACGRASVASRVGGVREVVTDGVTGLLVEPADAGSLSDALLALLMDPLRRAEMQQAALRRAVEHFDRRVWVERLKAVYDERSAGRPGRRRLQRR